MQIVCLHVTFHGGAHDQTSAAIIILLWAEPNFYTIMSNTSDVRSWQLGSRLPAKDPTYVYIRIPIMHLWS